LTMARSSRRTSRTPPMSKCHLALFLAPFEKKKKKSCSSPPVSTDSLRALARSTQPPGDLRRGCLGSALSFQHLRQARRACNEPSPQLYNKASMLAFASTSSLSCWAQPGLQANGSSWRCYFFHFFLLLLLISCAGHGRSSPLQGRDLRGPWQSSLVRSLPLPPPPGTR
jgi:hypothetical protein